MLHSILITGAASGIGEGIAHRFAAEGAAAVLLDGLTGQTLNVDGGWVMLY